jgi:hypothetical protein
MVNGTSLARVAPVPVHMPLSCIHVSLLNSPLEVGEAEAGSSRSRLTFEEEAGSACLSVLSSSNGAVSVTATALETMPAIAGE